LKYEEKEYQSRLRERELRILLLQKITEREERESIELEHLVEGEVDIHQKAFQKQQEDFEGEKSEFQEREKRASK